ncbi:MAG: hypothetical protein N3A69_14470, partial [Leptospiraceae bacterium]|nr:hypothetical protein [Leptospiraceae bacterium]
MLSVEKSLVMKKALRSIITCNGTEQTISQTYTTESTVTASQYTSMFLTSGSYTVKPNLKFEGKVKCNFASGTNISSGEYKIT